MKKILMLTTLLFVLVLGGCDAGLDPEKVLEGQLNPFRSYKVIEKDVVKTLEEGILSTEAENVGLNLENSSAHVIAFTKIGSYAKGKVRILGEFTTDGLIKANGKNNGRIKSSIMNYTCSFEYSYKTGMFTWSSTYPYEK